MSGSLELSWRDIELDNLLDVDYESTSIIETERRARRTVMASTRQMGLRVRAGDGDNWRTGALGAEFSPDLSDRLRIMVLVGEGNPPEDPAALYVGLPEELARSVLDGALSVSELDELGAGVLRFDRALYHPASSTPALFRWLGAAVVKLLTSAQGLTDESLAARLGLADTRTSLKPVPSDVELLPAVEIPELEPAQPEEPSPVEPQPIAGEGIEQPLPGRREPEAEPPSRRLLAEVETAPPESDVAGRPEAGLVTASGHGQEATTSGQSSPLLSEYTVEPERRKMEEKSPPGLPERKPSLSLKQRDSLERYVYPPPFRSRKGYFGCLTVHLCAACGHYAAREIGPGRFKCYRCQSVVEYHVTREEGAS